MIDKDSWHYKMFHYAHGEIYTSSFYNEEISVCGYWMDVMMAPIKAIFSGIEWLLDKFVGPLLQFVFDKFYELKCPWGNVTFKENNNGTE